MTRFDTLRLLLAAEVADDLPSVEATMTEIGRRMDTLDRDSDAYAAAHRRLNELIGQRERLRNAAWSTVECDCCGTVGNWKSTVFGPFCGWCGDPLPDTPGGQSTS